MRFLIAAALAAILSLSASCSIYTEGRALFKEGRALVTEIRAEFKKAKAASDVNGDGKTSWSEWLTGGGLAAFATAVLAMLTRNGRSDVRKAKNEAKTEEQGAQITEQKQRLDKLDDLVRGLGSKS